MQSLLRWGLFLKKRNCSQKEQFFPLKWSPIWSWRQFIQDRIVSFAVGRVILKLLFNVWLEKIPSYLWNIKMCSFTLNKWRLTKYSKKPEQMHLYSSQTKFWMTVFITLPIKSWLKQRLMTESSFKSILIRVNTVCPMASFTWLYEYLEQVTYAAKCIIFDVILNSNPVIPNIAKISFPFKKTSLKGRNLLEENRLCRYICLPLSTVVIHSGCAKFKSHKRTLYKNSTCINK